MKQLIFTLTLTLLQAGVFLSHVQPESLPTAEKRKIEALIQYVATADQIQFVRNGRIYNSAAAATFLRRKWQANDSSVRSAREFIEKIADVSGTSGKPYLVRLKDGSELRSREFLLAALEKID